MKYAIKVQETIGKTVIVDAKNLRDAIGIVEEAVNNNDIMLDNVENFIGREIKFDEDFKDGVVPEYRDVSCYQHLMQRIIEATFISYWDGGIEVKEPCKVNTETKEVFDIQQADIEGLENIEYQKVSINGTLYDVFPDDISEEGEYWYE